MRITVLVDNNTFIDRYFLAEPGVSFFIEADGKRVLFDLGYSDIFLRNAEKMRINLRQLDYVVLSHGHMDHTWGLDPLIKLHTEAKFEQNTLTKPQLVGHQDVLQTKILYGVGEIGSLLTEEKLSKHFTMNLSKEPIWLTENLVFLGEIPRVTEFEAKTPIGNVVRDGKTELEPDYLLDDTGLVYKTSKGLVIIVGCSHAGICNIIEYAKQVCCEDKIMDVIGGFHLLAAPQEQLAGVLEYFGRLKPTEVHACHCTDLKAKIALSQVVNLQEVGVGLTIEIT